MMKPRIIYDGNCRVCSQIVNILQALDTDGRFDYFGRHSPEGQKAHMGLGLNPERTDSIIFISMYGYHTKSDAVLRILRTLGGLWGMFCIFRIIPKGIRDRMYDLVAANRHFLSGKAVNGCRIPDRNA